MPKPENSSTNARTELDAIRRLDAMAQVRNYLSYHNAGTVREVRMALNMPPGRVREAMLGLFARGEATIRGDLCELLPQVDAK